MTELLDEDIERVAQEIMGAKLKPLTLEQIEALDRRHQNIRLTLGPSGLNRSWRLGQQRPSARKKERLEAEAESRRIHAQASRAERMAREARERAALRAAETAAAQSAATPAFSGWAGVCFAP